MINPNGIFQLTQEVGSALLTNPKKCVGAISIPKGTRFAYVSPTRSEGGNVFHQFGNESGVSIYTSNPESCFVEITPEGAQAILP